MTGVLIVLLMGLAVSVAINVVFTHTLRGHKGEPK